MRGGLTLLAALLLWQCARVHWHEDTAQSAAATERPRVWLGDDEPAREDTRPTLEASR